MEFKKYPSIENSYREKFIHQVQRHEDFLGMQWQVTEKIHGANFSFVVDRETGACRIGKRSGLTDGTFYSCHAVLEKYAARVITLAMESVFDGCHTVQVYGELYGKGVQKGVFYSEEKDFAAFDIRWISDDRDEFLGTTPVQTLCEKFEIPHVPVLEELCGFDKAMGFDVDFNSCLSDRDDNGVEGVVIKPCHPMFLNGGSRVILKKKSDKFKEKSKSKKVKQKESFTDEMTAVFESMLDYVNENRLRNVLSKIGEIGQRDFGRLLGMFVQDVLEDWGKDYDFGVLDKKDRKAITKRLNQEAGILIRRNFLNIMDGVF